MKRKTFKKIALVVALIVVTVCVFSIFSCMNSSAVNVDRILSNEEEKQILNSSLIPTECSVSFEYKLLSEEYSSGLKNCTKISLKAKAILDGKNKNAVIKEMYCKGKYKNYGKKASLLGGQDFYVKSNQEYFENKVLQTEGIDRYVEQISANYTTVNKMNGIKSKIKKEGVEYVGEIYNSAKNVISTYVNYEFYGGISASYNVFLRGNRVKMISSLADSQTVITIKLSKEKVAKKIVIQIKSAKKCENITIRFGNKTSLDK